MNVTPPIGYWARTLFWRTLLLEIVTWLFVVIGWTTYQNTPTWNVWFGLLLSLALFMATIVLNGFYVYDLWRQPVPLSTMEQNGSSE